MKAGRSKERQGKMRVMSGRGKREMKNVFLVEERNGIKKQKTVSHGDAWHQLSNTEYC